MKEELLKLAKNAQDLSFALEHLANYGNSVPYVDHVEDRILELYSKLDENDYLVVKGKILKHCAEEMTWEHET